MKMPSVSLLESAVKAAPSPNMAMNGMKLMSLPPELKVELSKSLFEVAWADAIRFNTRVETWSGQVQRQVRLTCDDDGAYRQAVRIRLSHEPLRELGKVMSEYDGPSIDLVYGHAVDWFETLIAKK